MITPRPTRTLARAAIRLGISASIAAAFVLHATAAHPVGTLAGPATVKAAGGAANLGSGDSGTPFTLALPAGAACPGDSANAGYRWQTYMVPSSVDPGSLTFGANGPEPGGTNANFRQPLFDVAGGAPVVNQQTANADAPGGPGPILNISDVNYAVFGAGVIDAGVYNVGIACTLGPPGAEQLKNYWNVQKTFAAGGGPSQVNWTAAVSQVTTTTVAGTTTTTGAGGTTTTTRPGTTTTTRAGGSTTTVAGGSTTTTAAGGTTTSSVAGGSATTPTTTSPLARTGGSSIPLLAWAVLLVILGRMVVLVVRTPQVRPGARN